MLKEEVRTYIDELTKLELEAETIREARKSLDADFKDKIDVKAVKQALRIQKLRASGDAELIDEVLDILGVR